MIPPARAQDPVVEGTPLMIDLRGITWDHTRGYGPMRATAREFNRMHPDVQIVWERRSLHSFGEEPIDALAGQYDLLVIDHPHCGLAASEGCLIPIDRLAQQDELTRFAAGAVGQSHASYAYAGHQWALAIDAAAQVSASRPDRLQEAPRTWNEVLDLAQAGRVLWPIKPVDAFMSFLTLAANQGTPCAQNGRFIRESDGEVVLEAMIALAERVTPSCAEMSPIDVLEAMATSDKFDYCPLLFGYSNYARAGFRRRTIAFHDIPALGGGSPRGSVLGGAGLAISSRCRWPEVAAEYAFWVAGSECQCGLYFDAGGQPASLAAWNDAALDERCNGFFRNTRRTLDGCYLRPRYDGYLEFQTEAGRILSRFLAGEQESRRTLAWIEACYQESRKQVASA